LLKAAELNVVERDTDRGLVLEVAGELDLTSVGRLADPILVHISRNEPTQLILDLTRVDFIDSAGLALFVDARNRLSSNERQLYLILASARQPERVLKLVRFDTIMKLVYSLDEIPALSAQSHQPDA
jgi:anti-sigma B factor antagonist